MAGPASAGQADEAAGPLSDGQDCGRAAELRAAMVGSLRDEGVIMSGAVADAFAAVPRHLFGPRETLEAAYAPHRTAP